MAKWNPQLKIEMVGLDELGQEFPIPFEVLYEDYRSYGQNTPPEYNCSIQKSLGSVQDSLSLTVFNPYFLERVNIDFEFVRQWFVENQARIKVWAWFSDSAAASNEPIDPVFIGDVKNDFSVNLEDGSITFEALSQLRLNRKSRVKRNYPALTTHREIVEDFFGTWVAEKGFIDFLIFDEFEKLAFEIPRTRNVDRSGAEVLNDICKQHDMIWGVDNNRLYIADNQLAFDLLFNTANYDGDVETETGKIGLTGFSFYNFTCRSLNDEALALGRPIYAFDADWYEFSVPKRGRIDEISYSLTNKSHTVDMSCSFYDGTIVLLPPTREDASGRAVA